MLAIILVIVAVYFVAKITSVIIGLIVWVIGLGLGMFFNSEKVVASFTLLSVVIGLVSFIILCIVLWNPIFILIQGAI